VYLALGSTYFVTFRNPARGLCPQKAHKDSKKISNLQEQSAFFSKKISFFFISALFRHFVHHKIAHILHIVEYWQIRVVDGAQETETGDAVSAIEFLKHSGQTNLI